MKRSTSSAWRSFLLLMAASLFAAALVAQTPEQLLRQGMEALNRKDYAGAAQAFEAYLARPLEGYDYRVEANLAIAYTQLGRRQDAIRLYRNVLSHRPDLVPVHDSLAELLLREGGTAEAAEHLQFVVEKDPDAVLTRVALADALASLRRPAEAREQYERALERNPDLAAAHFAFGRFLAETDPAAAETHLRRALEIEPALEDARLLMAQVLETRSAPGADTLAEAAGMYRQYLQKHPDRSDVRIRLGQVYASLQRFADAAAQWETARAAGDSSAELSRALLQAYLQGSGADKDKALALLQEILANPEAGNDAELRLLNGTLRMEKRQYQEAAQQFRRVTELRPDSAEAFKNLASALYLLDDYQGTLAALERVAQRKQDTAGTYFLRAITCDKLHLAQPALENYQRFLELNGGKSSDQEFQARQRSKILERELSRSGGRRR